VVLFIGQKIFVLVRFDLVRR